MQRVSFSEMNCSVAQTLEVVGEWWSLLIVRDALLGLSRFDDFQRHLGISRNVLNDRLARLVDQGVLEKVPYQDHPPRHDYRLTPKGLDLWEVVDAMRRWGDRWEAPEAGPPTELIHRSCGRPTTVEPHCSECGERLEQADLKLVAGPGADEHSPFVELLRMRRPVTDWTSVAAVAGDDGLARCGWCLSTPDYVAYHDDEWGRPVVDDVRLYEKLCLEGFQSGLSWLTILRKRPAFRQAFAGFEPEAVARFDEADVQRLLADAGIVRHRGKIEAAMANARATLEVQDRLGSLAALVWSFEPERATRPAPAGLGEVASTTPESTALSKALKRQGFRFVGPTTAYAAMQSLGVVNDHLAGCHVRSTCDDDRAASCVPRPTDDDR